jgi:hypothetical protein
MTNKTPSKMKFTKAAELWAAARMAAKHIWRKKVKRVNHMDEMRRRWNSKQD